MKKQRRTMVLAFLASLLGGETMALADSEQLTGTGSTYWGRSQIFSTTSACVLEKVGSTPCLLFPASRTAEHKSLAVIIRAARPVRCSYAGAPALPIAADCTITDASGPWSTGPGSCIVLNSAGMQSDEKPSWQTLVDRRSSGIRTGLCSNLVRNGGDVLHAPCLETADCTNYGGGNCIGYTALTSDQQKKVGLFLNCVAITNTASVSVQKQDVPRY